MAAKTFAAARGGAHLYAGRGPLPTSRGKPQQIRAIAAPMPPASNPALRETLSSPALPTSTIWQSYLAVLERQPLETKVVVRARCYLY